MLKQSHITCKLDLNKWKFSILSCKQVYVKNCSRKGVLGKCWRKLTRGGGGVSQMLTIADEGGRGGKPNADYCWQGVCGSSKILKIYSFLQCAPSNATLYECIHKPFNMIQITKENFWPTCAGTPLMYSSEGWQMGWMADPLWRRLDFSLSRGSCRSQKVTTEQIFNFPPSK